MFKNLKTLFSNPSGRTVGLLFATCSIIFGSWIARLPDIKHVLHLSDGQLGLALLGIPIGVLLINPFAGWLIERGGVGQVAFWSTIAFCFAILFTAQASAIFMLAFSLFLVGLSDGLMNIAMNTAASAIEKENGISIMSTCHGMFSIGGMAGAGIGSALAALGISVSWHFTGVAILMILLQLYLRPELFRFPTAHSEGAVFAWPNKALLAMAMITFCMYIGEGSIADWSAIYLRESLGCPIGLAGWGFAGFSLSMAIFRFNGDTLIPRLGPRFILTAGSLLAASGYAIAVFLPSPYTAIAGFTAAGIGCSCIIPIVFGASTRVPGIAPGTGLAMLTTFGITGYMLAPPVIGMISEFFGMRYALGGVGALLLLVALLGNTKAMENG